MDTKELVERCIRGEEQAMAALYTRYVRMLEGVSRKYVKDEADVQDIVHDSFVIILTSMYRLKDAAKLESWMCTIVRNLSLKHLQQPIALSLESVEVEACEEAVDEPDYDKLMEIVEQLPLGYKNVLKLSVLEGLSHKEIGEMLGIAPHSSSSQLARAKAQVLRNAKRYGLLLLALIATLIPFLLPDEEKPQEEVAKVDEPRKKIEKTEPKTPKAEAIDNVEAIEAIEAIKAIEFFDSFDSFDSFEKIDSLENIENPEKSEKSPTDTTRQSPLPIPDARHDRLIAKDYQPIKTRVDDAWALTVSFTGAGDNNLLARANIPGIGSGIDDPYGKDDPDYQTPDTTINTRTHQYMPLTLSLSISKQLSIRWSMETGLRYTLLRTDITQTISVSDGSMAPTTETITQKLHYIGIPLKLTYNLWSTRQFSLYGSGGAAADIPVGSSNPVLWSVNFGAGLQYHITPSVSLYTEPGMNYYLNADSGTPTIHTDRPFEFTVPLGLRISW